MKKSKKILLGAGTAIGILAATNAVKAARYKPEKRTTEALPLETADVERFIRNLSDSIQIPAIANADPALTDWSVFERLHAFLRERYPLIHNKLELELVSRASLMFRWPGTNPALDPMAMIAHLDVVPVTEGTEGDWKYPPYSGHYDGEFIWGRGSLDMKNHLIGLMESVEILLAEGFSPERDVYLCLGHNEEPPTTSETSGASAMARVLQKRGLRLDSLNDEGGTLFKLNIKGVIKDKCIVAIGIAEKGYGDFSVSTFDKGGHSSQPPKHSALGRLAGVIQDIENNQFKGTMPDLTSNMLQEAGKHFSFPVRLVACNLPLLKPFLTKLLAEIPETGSFVKTTTAVTMASGSPAHNILPQKATINANFRIMPGMTLADVEQHIKDVSRNKNIEVKLYKGQEPSSISDLNTKSYKKLEKLFYDMYGGDVLVAPYIVMGATDAYRYQAVTNNIYRFSPFFVDVRLLNLTHGTNERLPATRLGDSLIFFKRYIRTMSVE